MINHGYSSVYDSASGRKRKDRTEIDIVDKANTRLTTEHYYTALPERIHAGKTQQKFLMLKKRI